MNEKIEKILPMLRNLKNNVNILVKNNNLNKKNAEEVKIQINEVKKIYTEIFKMNESNISLYSKLKQISAHPVIGELKIISNSEFKYLLKARTFTTNEFDSLKDELGKKLTTNITLKGYESNQYVYKKLDIINFTKCTLLKCNQYSLDEKMISSIENNEIRSLASSIVKNYDSGLLKKTINEDELEKKDIEYVSACIVNNLEDSINKLDEILLKIINDYSFMEKDVNVKTIVNYLNKNHEQLKLFTLEFDSNENNNENLVEYLLDEKKNEIKE